MEHTFRSQLKDLGLLQGCYNRTERSVYSSKILVPFVYVTFLAISLSSSLSAISRPAAPPILVPITMLPTIVAAGPGSEGKIVLKILVRELNNGQQFLVHTILFNYLLPVIVLSVYL